MNRWGNTVPWNQMPPCMSWTLAVVEVAWRSLASCPWHLWYLTAAHMHSWRFQTAIHTLFRMASLWVQLPLFLILRSNTDPHTTLRIPLYLVHCEAGLGSHDKDSHFLPASELELEPPMFPAQDISKLQDNFTSIICRLKSFVAYWTQQYCDAIKTC